MDASGLWRFLPIGYLLTILIETPILVLGLSPPHSLRRRLMAGVWLTGCTYPIVVLVLPLLIPERSLYLLIGEIFAPVAECILFWLAFGASQTKRNTLVRDFLVITIANVASFAVGELLNHWEWFGLF